MSNNENPRESQGSQPPSGGTPRQEPGYPPQGPGYPQQGPSYSQQGPGYPQQDPSYSRQGPRYDGGYPQQGPGYDRGYPQQGSRHDGGYDRRYDDRRHFPQYEDRGNFRTQGSRAPAAGALRAPNPTVRVLVTVLGLMILVAMLGLWGRSAAIGAPVWEQTSTSGEESAAGLERIVVHSHTSDVTVTTSSTDVVEWSARIAGNPDRFQSAITRTQNDTLELRTARDNWGWFTGGIGWWGWDDQWLQVTVPESLLADLEVDAGVGTTLADGDWSDVVINGGVGDVTVNGTATSLDVNAGVGQVSSTLQIDGGALLVDGGVGEIDIRVTGDTVPGSIDISGGVGNITIALPATTMGYVVQGSTGIGDHRNNAPVPDPDGIKVDAPVQVTIEGGIGNITLTTSE